jgi:transposase-like protein
MRFFQDEQRAFECVRDRRWPTGVYCPRCGAFEVKFMEKRKAWNCNGCRKQFTAKTGTIFEESPIQFSKWLPAMWLIANAKNGISSYELHRSIGVTQKTAWFMLHRIRLAMQNGTFGKLGGEVEVDETYIGGKARNMHYKKRTSKNRIGGAGKAMVMGFVERGGKVVTKHVDNLDRQKASHEVKNTVDESSKLFTDSLYVYGDLSFYYQHQMVNHAVTCVKGNVHTNTLEN